MPQDEVEAMAMRLKREVRQEYERGRWSTSLANPDGPEAAALLTRLSAQLKDAREELARRDAADEKRIAEWWKQTEAALQLDRNLRAAADTSSQ